MADKHPSDGRDNSSAAGWAQRRTDVPDLPGYKGGVTGSRVNGDVRSQMTARRRAVNEGPGWKESQNKRS